MARPSKHSGKLVDEICERLALGETLRQICLDEHMPSARTIHRWKAKDKELRNRVFDARIDGIWLTLDEVVEILKAATDRDSVMRAREIANHFRWMAERLVPELREKVQSDVNQSGEMVVKWAEPGEGSRSADGK